jgi:hypothetical protein
LTEHGGQRSIVIAQRNVVVWQKWRPMNELKASYSGLAKSYDTLAKEADDVEQSGLCLSGSVPISTRCLYPFHIRRKRALMSTGSLGGLCPFAGTAGTGHAHP